MTRSRAPGPGFVSFAGVCLSLTLLGAAPSAVEGATPPAPGTCLSGEEMELGRLINAYRQAHGLDPVPLTRSLSLVAKWHAVDLQDHGAGAGQDGRGRPCGLHSWSDKGPWSAVCYTSDHEASEKMWRKPRELTGGRYPGYGFENVYFTSHVVTPQRALEYWKGRSDENAIVLEQGAWSRGRWPAMGIGIYEQYAVLWFGDAKDPLGLIRACGESSPATADNRRPAERSVP